MDKNEKLRRAKALLTAFEKALPHADAICNTVDDWEAGEEAPPLLKSNYSWCEATKDEERIKQFRALLYFLAESLFGVDCDNDSALAISVIDRARDQRPPRYTRVPRISDRPTLKEIWTALRCAKLNEAMSRTIKEGVERELEFYIEDSGLLKENSDEQDED